MSLSGCQINPIDVNFHLQNVWTFLVNIQLTKSEGLKGGKIELNFKCLYYVLAELFILSAHEEKFNKICTYLEILQ